MKAKVPISETGSASAGISVADSVFRNRKMTRMTSTIAMASVSFTSCTESRIDLERSLMTETSTEAGSCDW